MFRIIRSPLGLLITKPNEGNSPLYVNGPRSILKFNRMTNYADYVHINVHNNM